MSKVSTEVDSTTQAEYFLNGLKKTIVHKLQGTVSPDVMQDIDKLNTSPLRNVGTRNLLLK